MSAGSTTSPTPSTPAPASAPAPGHDPARVAPRWSRPRLLPPATPASRPAGDRRRGPPHRAATDRTPQRRPLRREHDMNPTYDFTGQVALVTGASSGMGLATARAFAASGAAVALTDINDAALNAAAQELTEAGHQALALTYDVSDEDQV